jgi:cytolysin (calcineurin-like family phosphatase)
MPVLDAATMLIPSGAVSTGTTDFPALQVAPRFLPTCAWVVSMLTPPSAAATFSLAVSSTQNGTFTTIDTFQWPAGTSGSKSVALGVQGDMVQFVNNQAAWVRASVTCTGALTCTSWLTKAADGGPGLASRSYSLDGVNAL